MSGAGAIACNCCSVTCEGIPCEECADGTPISFTVTLAGITISSSELLLGGTHCWRFTTTSNANGTFCAIQSEETPCEWTAAVPAGGAEDGGEDCEFFDSINSTLGITLFRISSTEFQITVHAFESGDGRLLVFRATFESEICYLDGAVVNNELAIGDLADDESDGYIFLDNNAWNMGYGGTATITACCP